MDIALILVVALLVILFFVGFWPASRTWKWFHLFFLALVLFASGFYLVLSAEVLKTKAAWGQLYEKTLKDLETVQAQNDVYKKGTPELMRADELATQPAAKNAVERLLMSRGRAWRGCMNMGIQGNTVTIRVPLNLIQPAVPPNPAVPVAPEAAAENRSHGIAEHTILYAFSEVAYNSRFGEVRVPDFYLGEFDVVGTSPDTVVLRMTMPPDAQQNQIIGARATTWTMYERMPTDSHYSYEEYLKLENNGVPPTPEQAADVARVMSNLIKRLPEVTDESYQKTMQQYLRNGKGVEQDDPPERVYARVRFLKAYEMEVDSPNKQPRLDSEYYDLQGNAVQPELRREEKAKLSVGDFAILHLQKADELASEGIVEKVATYYQRPLHDFKVHFHSIFHRMDALDDRINEVQRLVQETDSIQRKIQTQVDYRNRELMRLQQDLTNHKADLAAVTEYEGQAQTELGAIRDRVTSLQEANQKLFSDIATLQAQMADEILKGNQQTSAGN